jgi:hypothetical protein
MTIILVNYDPVLVKNGLLSRETHYLIPANISKIRNAIFELMLIQGSLY